jgi:hypothetical protein
VLSCVWFRIGLFYILAKSYTFSNGVSITDYTLPAWKIKQLKKFHKTLKNKHDAIAGDITRWKKSKSGAKRFEGHILNPV